MTLGKMPRNFSKIHFDFVSGTFKDTYVYVYINSNPNVNHVKVNISPKH